MLRSLDFVSASSNKDASEMEIRIKLVRYAAAAPERNRSC
jgi:hypothetical protein